VPKLKPRSFFVRILPERPRKRVGAPILRGYAVELPDGTERWFEDLAQLPALIAALLDGNRVAGDDPPQGGCQNGGRG